MEAEIENIQYLLAKMRETQQAVATDIFARRRSGSSTSPAGVTDLNSFKSALARVKKQERKCMEDVQHLNRIVFFVENVLKAPRGNFRLGPEGFHTVHRARVPVVKVSNEVHASGIAFDVVVNNNIALRNSALLRSYAAYDERARQLMLLVKSWAKERRLNEAPNGTLSSYAHVNLVIFFLTKTRGEIEEMMRGTPAMTGSSKTNDDGERRGAPLAELADTTAGERCGVI